MSDVIEAVRRKRSLPVYLQGEMSECGPACLAMVSTYHGHEMTVSDMREIAPVSNAGLTLLTLMRDATRIGLTVRPLKLELEELGDLQVPCVLHWDLNHFVVLKSVKGDAVEIHDPARGLVRLTRQQAGKHFTGIALELEPSDAFEPARRNARRISLSSLFGKTVGLKRSLLHVLALAVVLETFVLVTPLYVQWVIDQVIVSADSGLLNVIAVGFAFVCVFRTVVTSLRAWVITWVGANLNAQWEKNLFRHLLALTPGFFEKRHIGDVLSRFNSAKVIQNALSTQFVGTLLDGVMSLLTLALMYSYSGSLTLVVLGSFAVYLAGRQLFFGPLRSGTEGKIERQAEQQSCLIEAVRGARALQLANQQPGKVGEYAGKLVAAINKDVSVQRLQICFEMANNLIFGLCRVCVVWMAARLVMEGRISAGMLISFLAYADLFSQRGAKFVDQVIELKMLGMHGERVADVALAPVEQRLYPIGPTTARDASLEVRNLGFRYNRDEPWVLRNVSFRIDAGESVAIIGPSGSGKSTLAKLILGLLEAEEGQILFGGQPVDQLGRIPYRDQLASVMQDDTLFSGTIGGNIGFFDPQATMERIREAAAMAQIHDDIVRMPMGYNTLIGDMGAALSGGQRQRILLARALYRKPRVLLLDEATSHLDSAKERAVNSVVSGLDLTRIIIAHRQETIATASRVIDLVRINAPARRAEETLEPAARAVASC